MNAVLTELYGSLLPTILTVIGMILTWLIAGVAQVIKARWGIDIEAAHRAALHSALMSGITAALSRGLSGSDAVSAAVSYATKSVPDALAALDPSSEVLHSLAESKLRQALDLTFPSQLIDSGATAVPA